MVYTVHNFRPRNKYSLLGFWPEQNDCNVKTALMAEGTSLSAPNLPLCLELLCVDVRNRVYLKRCILAGKRTEWDASELQNERDEISLDLCSIEETDALPLEDVQPT